jgi:hypothetical protein
VSASAQPVTSVADFPGVNDVVSFGTGDAALDVGYRALRISTGSDGGE